MYLTDENIFTFCGSCKKLYRDSQKFETRLNFFLSVGDTKAIQTAKAFKIS